MLPGGRVVLLRFTHTVVPRRSPRPKWIVGAVAAGVVGGSWFAASSLHDAGEGDAQEVGTAQRHAWMAVLMACHQQLLKHGPISLSRPALTSGTVQRLSA